MEMEDMDVGSKKILVIDDMPAILKVLRRQLEHWGFQEIGRAHV